MSSKMVNKIYILILAIYMALGCVACSDDPVAAPEPVPYSPGTITLSFRNSSMSRSEDSDNSEYYLDNLTIGLYPLTATDDTPATMWLTYYYLNASNSEQFTVQLTNDMVDELFGNVDGAKCRIFALANMPEDVDVPDHASINQMKQSVVEANFKTVKKQESFVMSGGNAEVEYKAKTNLSEKGHAIGLVTLERTAAKINLNIKLPDKIEVKDESGTVKETWRPVTSRGVRALLNNGVQTAYAVTPDPDQEGNRWKPTNSDAYYDSELIQNSERVLSDSKTGEYPYVMDVPFYTYPNAWTENVEEHHKTSLTLLVPWQKDGDGDTWHTLYYLVPITPSDITFLLSNHAYTVNLEVGMLGSLVPDTPIEVTDVSYQIVNWGSENLDVPIEENRYLVVNPNTYSFNNEANMSIPYYTSHPVEITDLTIEYQRFNFVSDSTNVLVGTVVSFTIDEEQIDATNAKNATQPICTTSLTKTADQEYVNIYHPLNLWTPYHTDASGDVEVTLFGHNDVNSETELKAEVKATADSIDYYMPIDDDAFSMYTIRFTLRHKDRPEFMDTVAIYQYPAIYIEAYRNPYSIDNSPTNNVWVNGYSNRKADSNTSSPTYGSILGIKNGWNQNPNMYIITVTSLSDNNTYTIIDETNGNKSETYNYMIGDPRMREVRNFLNTEYIDANNKAKGWANLPATPYTAELDSFTSRVRTAFYDNKSTLYPKKSGRTLKYYYNTIEDGSVATMLSPQFRIASSWGVTSGITRPYARYRAALYQENIFPGGRWRVPTLAEFCFINKLSAENKIPTLFSKGVPYWTSEGLYKGMPDGTIRRHYNQGRTSAVRAVYDDWYWKEYTQWTVPKANTTTPDSYFFRLGDAPRNVAPAGIN